MNIKTIEAYKQGFKDELTNTLSRDYDNNSELYAYHIGRLYTLISPEDEHSIDGVEDDEILEVLRYFELED